MSRLAQNLTKELVSAYAANIPRDKHGKAVNRKYFGDGVVGGLFFEVFVNKEKEIFAHWDYRVPGRSKRIPLGPYPKVSLEQAREKALLN